MPTSWATISGLTVKGARPKKLLTRTVPRTIGGRPPGGTYVCYDCWGTLEGEHRNWGHIGLSVGDGKVIHTWGGEVRMDDYRTIEDLDASEWTTPEYIGWVPVSSILKGMPPR